MLEEFIHPSTLSRGTLSHFDFYYFLPYTLERLDLDLINNNLNICNFMGLATVITGIQIHKTNIKKDMFQ